MKTLSKKIEESKIKNDPLYAELWQYNGIMLEMKKQWVFSVTEKYGLYDGQMEFCKKVAYEIYRTGKSYKKSYEQLSKNFDKGIFFSYIEINYIPNVKNHYKLDSKLDKDTEKLDKIIIYLDSNRVTDREDILTKLVHEMTHAYGQYVSLLKNAPTDLKDIANSYCYRYLTSFDNTDNNVTKSLKGFLYACSSVEKQPFLNGLHTAIENLKDKYKNRVATYDEYLSEIRNMEEFKMLADAAKILGVLQKDSDESKTIVDIYNKANGTNLSKKKVENKIIFLVGKWFKKFKRIMAKAYYDYVEEFRNKTDESISALTEIEMWPIYKHYVDYEILPESDILKNIDEMLISLKQL